MKTSARIQGTGVLGAILFLLHSASAADLPDLVPVVLEAPTHLTAPPNPTVTLVWGATNQGVGPTASGWGEEVLLSTNAVLDSTATTISIDWSGFEPLLAGAARMDRHEVRFPVVVSGAYYILFRIDRVDSVPESDEDNNVLSIPFTFESIPSDLAPALLQVPAVLTGPPYPEVTLTWSVTNHGIGPAVGTWADSVYVSTNTTLDPAARWVHSQGESTLVPVGGRYSRTNTVRLPVTGSGDYYLFLKTDSSDYLVESDETNNELGVPFTFHSTPPDLVPLTEELPRLVTGPPHPPLTLVWGATNQGIGPAIGNGYWVDRLYLSARPVLDGSAQEISWGGQEGPIPVGGVYRHTNTVRLPVTATGTYYLFIKTDDSNSLIESDEDNNSVAVPFAFQSTPPDLAPIPLQAPAMLTGPPHPELTLVWGITNQGIGPALGLYSWSDRLWFSTNTVLDGGAREVTAWSQSGLVPAGGNYALTNAVRLPATESGNCYLIFRTDADGQLIESDESNNQVIVPFTFNCTPPDLAPASVQMPAVLTGPPNPEVMLAWSVTNQGAGSAIGYWDWTDHLLLSTNAFSDGSARSVETRRESGPIPAGGAYGFTNAVRLPVTESGTYYLIFQTDTRGELIESDEGNNQLAVPFTFNCTPPDLLPIAVQVPSSLTGPPNLEVTLAWVVTNQGTGPAIPYSSWPNRDLVWLSTNASGEADSQLVGEWSRWAPVPAGGAYGLTNTVRLPVTESGTYHLIFETDASGTMIESDESNNALAVPFTFNCTPPDLTPVSFQAPPAVTAPPNPSVTLVWGVTNQGIGLAAGGWFEEVYLSTRAVIDETARPVGGWSEPGPLAVEESSWRTNTVRLPVTESGSYFLIFTTDARDSLVELDENNNTVSVPFTFHSTPPDLTPIALQLSAVVTGPPNPRVTLSWGVTNQGIGPAAGGGWRDKVYVSTSAVLDGTTWFVGEWSQWGLIAPGESYGVTNALRLPVTASGNYYLVVRADDENALPETDESNNLLAVPFTFHATPPDLAPTGLQAPAVVTGPPNPNLPVSWEITNQGIGPAVGNWSWTDQLFLSRDPVWDWSDRAVATQYESGPVPAGGSYRRARTVSLALTESGAYYLILQADAGSSLVESDESNNVLVVALTYNSTPADLAPIALDAPGVVIGPPYPEVSISWGITNQGVGPAGGPWYDQLYVSTNAVWDGMARPAENAGSGDPVEPGPVPAGGSYRRTRTVRLPVTESGTYYLTLRTDDRDSLVEPNEADNERVVPFTFSATPPDLMPVSIQVPDVVTGGARTSVTVVWGVTNQGSGLAMGGPYWRSWEDRMHISTHGVLDDAATVIDSGWESGPIPAGSSYWRTNTVVLDGLTNGTYYLVLETDADDGLIESDEANNVLAVAFTYNLSTADLADLTPAAFQVPSEVTGPPGPSVTLVWGVTNQGVDAANSPWFWYHSVYLSTNATLEGALRHVTVLPQTQPIPAGGSCRGTNTVRLPVTENGTYYLGFRADAGNAVAESNESNNLVVVPFTFNATLADLSPVAFQAPSVVTGPPNPSVTVLWGITNRGLGLADSSEFYSWDPEVRWWDEVFVSTNSVFDETTRVVSGWAETNAIPAGGSYWRTNTLRLPIVESGTYYLMLRADAWNRVFESHESNNIAVASFTFIATPPDLAPVAFQVPSVVSAACDPTVTLVWGVTNQGVGPAEGTGGWYDRVLVSVNAVPDGTEQWASGWVETNAVPAGGSYWRTNTVQLRLDCSGTYYLIFQTDHWNHLPESDESNNFLAVPFTFNITPSDLMPVTFQAPTVVTGPPSPRLTLIWGVANQGVGLVDSNRHWRDQVYLSGSAMLNGSERPISEWYETGPVPSGGCYWRTNSLRVPVTDSGTYYLIFQANADYSLDEASVLNNAMAIPVTFNLSEPPSAGTLEGGFLPDGSFFVDVYAASGTLCTLEASTDLLRWERVADFICTEYPTMVLDPDATRFDQRFYRVTLLTQPAELRLDLATGTGWETNGPELIVEGPVGHHGSVLASADFRLWQLVTQFHLARSPIRFRDPSATNAAVRFYWAIVE